MKLLFDHNLSSRLVKSLSDLYPSSASVSELGLKNSDDISIWNFARKKKFIIVSKDSDFHQFSFLYGAPPKFVWIRLGNCSTKEIEIMLRKNFIAIKHFSANKTNSLLILE
jgi:predicted nuclease of predicted toxin-antitoxin system